MTRRRALTIIILLILIGLLSALAGVLFGLVKLPDLITSHSWVALLLVGVVLGVLGYWLYRAQSPAEKLPLRRQNRQRMLARARTRITKQLADSLPPHVHRRGARCRSVASSSRSLNHAGI